MQTIVVGVDGSAQSIEALRWAVDEAKLRDAKVVATHAWEAASTVTPYGAVYTPERDTEDLRSAARELLEAAVEKAAPLAEAQIECVAVEGMPAAVLVTAAHDADLLVVGSRGFGGFKGLLLGSVSQQVVHHAPCPVVVIRASTREARVELEPVGTARATT